MSTPVLQQCNMVGNVLYAADMGLAAGTVLATSSPKNLTTLKTAVPETLCLVVRQSSGTASYLVDVNATGGYSTTVYSIASNSGTSMMALVFDTTTSSPYVGMQVTTSANAIIDRFAVLSLSRLTAGEEFRSVLAGRNAVAGLQGTALSDGSGTWSAGMVVAP